MKTEQLRDKFLKFFAKKNHQVVDSSSVVPKNDSSLLFTNAGMVQFKDVFSGLETREYKRAVTSQICIRAGGKHNDLENVGFTTRHHTFFEMLGNFSFGDYFKKEAIEYAFEFITKVLDIPKEKLWITVYKDDLEAANIWFDNIGINKNKLSYCGEKDNFWSMGDTGPCGPCSEIFYDHGPEISGGPPGSPDQDGDRYVEIWNLVFMQFNKDKYGNLNPLPKPSIDTGMGLERVAAILQNVHSNYDIDLFQHLIKAAAKLLKVQDLQNNSLKVIADHIRTSVFLVADDVLPSNEGRGYVLRRIMRRAIRHGRKLDCHQPFLYKLVEPLTEIMGNAFPYIRSKEQEIIKVIEKEEIQFGKTIEQGLKLLDQVIKKTVKNISGETVFKLYDTYGFPVDLTETIAKENNLNINMDEFNILMKQQKVRARGNSNFVDKDKLSSDINSEFTGYDQLTADKSIIKEIFLNNNKINSLNLSEYKLRNKPDILGIVLDKTPFYAESGGQVGDTGILEVEIKPDLKINLPVLDTKKINKAIVSLIDLENIDLNKLGLPETIKLEIKVNDTVFPQVDSGLRSEIKKHHSATHLLHAVLRSTLGTHVEQKGSIVEHNRLRFDFANPSPVSSDKIKHIEYLVNQKIQENSKVSTTVMTYKDADASGAIALFGEKYSETVRVLNMGDGFSVELCGGTHVNKTGDIGCFKIYSETGVSSGVRRIEAVVGMAAVDYIQAQINILNDLSNQLKCPIDKIFDKTEQLLVKIKNQDRELLQAKKELSINTGDSLDKYTKVINDITVISKILTMGDSKLLRETLDNMKKNLGQDKGVIALAVVEENIVKLVTGVTDNCTDKVKAGELVNMVASQVGGKGGGRADFAQAGGTEPEKLVDAMHSVFTWVEKTSSGKKTCP